MPALSPTLALACELIRRPSVTPADQGCQALMMQRLAACGFAVQPMRIGEVDNFWAVRGEKGPLLCFAGHTDVVPTGGEERWTHPPFAAHIDDNGMLHGRGAADMKGSLAAMLVASERFVRKHPKHSGQIAFLITSDEEGPAVHGTRAVVERLRERGQPIDWCIVGEPSSGEKLGDVVKNGRRGSLSCQIRVIGKQGHVAYPQLAKNPIHLAAPLLAELSATHWDAGNDFFPPTSFQISNIHGGTGAGNVIPGELSIQCNFRFSTESSADSLKQRLTDMVQRHRLDCELKWTLFGEPFFTAPGALLDAVCQSVELHCGFRPRAETTGGTSDGRFIAPLGAQVVELGPLNATIHQIDEQVAAADLEKLTDIYQSCLERLLLL